MSPPPLLLVLTLLSITHVSYYKTNNLLYCVLCMCTSLFSIILQLQPLYPHRMSTVSHMLFVHTKHLIIEKKTMGQLYKIPQQIMEYIIKLLSLEWVSYATLSAASILITDKNVLKMMVCKIIFRSEGQSK